MRAFHPVSLFEYHWMNETGEWAMRLLCVIISHFKHLSCWYYICIRLNQVVFINFVHIVRRAARCRCCCSFFTWYVRLSAVLNCAHSVELNFTLNGQSAFTPATFFRQKLHFEYLFFFFCCKFDTEHIVKCVFHWICDGFLHYSQALDLQRNLTAKLLLFVFRYFVLTWITLGCR